ncbi:MAG: MBL fold metallo-hydrolase, partial [Promethearchaeota archaeon]
LTKHEPIGTAIRFDFLKSDGGSFSVCYSGDTLPDERIGELATETDYLIHEATFLDDELELALKYNHSTPSGAGHIATIARAKNLILIHYSTKNEGKEDVMVQQAKKSFKGNVIVARDFMELNGYF